MPRNKLFSKRAGFTLIELLVAISIVAIAATIGFASYSQAQLLARDTKRKQDLRALATAIELYYQTNKQYPANGSWEYSRAGGIWITGLSTSYINRVPLDPVNTGPTGCGPYYNYSEKCLVYSFWSNACGTLPAGQFYALVAQLENNSDPDRCETKNYLWCDGRSLCPPNNTGGSNYGWSESSYIITSQ